MIHRPVWFVDADGEIFCGPPHEDPATVHRFKDPLVWDHGCLRCRHIGRRGEAECGRLVYLIAGGLSGIRGEPLVLITRVTAEEMNHMRRNRMDRAASMAYLRLSMLPKSSAA